jgi:hypothetical protein
LVYRALIVLGNLDTAGIFSSGRIEIINDEGEIIYECDCREQEEFEKSGIQLDFTCEVIDLSVRYISVFSSVEKGLFRTGEFELEGEFDPTKLTVLCTYIEYNGEDSDVFVTGFEYNGESIDCEFDSTRGISMDADIIDTKADED